MCDSVANIDRIIFSPDVQPGTKYLVAQSTKYSGTKYSGTKYLQYKVPTK